MSEKSGWISRRTFLRTALLVGGSAVLAACGTNANPQSGGTAPTPAPGGSGTNAGGGTNAITLKQWYHEYGETGTKEAAMRYAAEYSTVNPKVKVEVNWVPGDYTSKVAAALLTADGPDVFEGSPNIDMVRSGQIVALDDLYTADVKADFNPIDLQSLTINGKIYAVKMLDDMGLIYYRKSLLDKAGIKPPTNVDEVLDAAKKLTSGKVKGLFLGNDGGINALNILLPQSNGSDFLVDNKIVFNNDQTAAAWEKLREFNQANVLLIGAPTDWWDPSAFTQGLAAMQWTGLWAMPGIKKAIGDDFGVLPWVKFNSPKGRDVTFRGGWAEMVFGKGKNVDAAKQFVKWLWIDNTKDQQDWNLSYGFHVPPRMSAAKSATALQSGAPAQAVDILNKDGLALPPIWTPAMGTAVTDAVSNIVKKGADAKAETAAAAKKCDDELQKVLKG